MLLGRYSSLMKIPPGLRPALMREIEARYNLRTRITPAAVAGGKNKEAALTLCAASALPPTTTIFGPNVGRAILFHETKIIFGFLLVGRNT
jgi:hypothetical protein